LGDKPVLGDSIRRNFHTDNFAGLAFGGNFKRTAAHLAIGCEPLAGKARVNDHFAVLAAVGTLDVGKFFHARNLPAPGQSANTLHQNLPDQNEKRNLD
jgi:hypothetical protein